MSVPTTFAAANSATGLQLDGNFAACAQLNANNAFSGTNTAPTPAASDNSTTLATTAFVKSAALAVQGSFKNLFMSTTGTSAVVTIEADSVVLQSGSASYIASGVNFTASTGNASGVANSLDVGVWAYSTWYYVWLIYNNSSVAALFSLSYTAPTLPAGYTYSARIGAIYTQSATHYWPLGIIQYGRKVQYKVAAGGNTAALPAMASGSAGSVSIPTWVGVGVGNFIPVTAGYIRIVAINYTGSSVIIVAPNTGYGSYSSTTNPPPINIGTAAANEGNVVEMIPESTNIYWASNGGSCALFCFGWEDNL